ncbi:MAG: SufE family protein [Salinarimonas sp.]
MLPSYDEILANFEFIDDWEERYRYIIELGKLMPKLPQEAYCETNKVQGCASQVWLETDVRKDNAVPRLVLRGDSDAHIVRGLVALLIALYSNRTADEILETDAADIFEKLGLSTHLTPQRSNGVRAMVQRIQRDAKAALAA